MESIDTTVLDEEPSSRPLDVKTDSCSFLNNIYCDECSQGLTWANELPNEILVNIFSKLCFKDLCNVERVCKKWHQLARIAWLSRKELILDSSNIFGNLVKPYKASKNLDLNLFINLIKRLNGQGLARLDLAELRFASKDEFSDFLGVICQHCPNLTKISLNNFNLSLWSFPTLSFVQFVNSCSNLREINLSYSYFLKDASLDYLFEKCICLENVNISFCFLITGRCFLHATHNRIKVLKIDSCTNIEEKNIISLINLNPDIKHLSMNHKPCSGNLISFVVNRSRSLHTLELTGTGFDEITSDELNRIEFSQFRTLHTLDLSGSKNCNKIVAKILTSCELLKNLDVSCCKELTDDMFKVDKIRAPLQDLNLSFLNITDESLEALGRMCHTLLRLKIWSCEKLTQKGIIDCVLKLNKLSFLNASTTCIGNSFLERLVELNDRKMLISCNRTNVNPKEFLRKFKNTRVEVQPGNVHLYECKGIKFEVFMNSIYYKNLNGEIGQSNNNDEFMTHEF